MLDNAIGLVGHGDAPVLSEGCEPLISRQDAPPRYPVRCVARRRELPRERFRALALFGRRSPERVVRSSLPASENLHKTGLMHRSKQYLYSITSSARVSTVAGTSRPSALAV